MFLKYKPYAKYSQPSGTFGKKSRYFDKCIYSRSGRKQSGCDVVNETQIIMRKTGEIPSFFMNEVWKSP